MNALSLYVTTCRLVFQADINDNGAWNDINRLIMYLRQSLTCCVCGQLLTIPMTNTVSSCQHHVCKGCIGGKMRLKPSCSWCKDYSKFIENIQLRILLQCYKKLSLYIKKSDLSKKWAFLETGNNPGVLIGSTINSNLNQSSFPSNFKELIDEGSNLSDKFIFYEPPNLKSHKTNIGSTNFLPSSSNNNSNSISQTHQKLNTSIISLNNLQDNNIENLEELNQISVDKANITIKNVLNQSNDDLIKNFPQATIIRLSNQNIKSENILNSSNFTNQIIPSNNNSLSNIQTLNLKSTSPILNMLTPTKIKGKIRKGCRCGLATPNPGKLTCCGQRCPCYVEGKACFECKCRGCRNPNKNSSSSLTNDPNINMSIGNTTTLITISNSGDNTTKNNSINSKNCLNQNLNSSFNSSQTSNIQFNNSNQTTLLSSSNTGNLLSPSFLLSSSNSSQSSMINHTTTNQHQMLRSNLFPSGTTINIISSTSSSPTASIIGVVNNHNNSNVSVGVDSLTLPFPKLEEIDDDQVISTDNVCIDQEENTLNSSIIQTLDLQTEPEIITVVTKLNESDQIKIGEYD